jgi:hypothetical protein
MVFHNIVNTKLNKEDISIEYLEKYKTSIPNRIIKNFKIKFFKRNFNERLMIDNFTVRQQSNNINNLLHQILFDM